MYFIHNSNAAHHIYNFSDFDKGGKGYLPKIILNPWLALEAFHKLDDAFRASGITCSGISSRDSFLSISGFAAVSSKIT